MDPKPEGATGMAFTSLNTPRAAQASRGAGLQDVRSKYPGWGPDVGTDRLGKRLQET